jgi:hypothetical protein
MNVSEFLERTGQEPSPFASLKTPASGNTCKDCINFIPITEPLAFMENTIMAEGDWGNCQRPSKAILAALANITPADAAACTFFRAKEEV